MELISQRISGRKDSTYGILYHNSEQLCFTIEDEYREVKVDGETRIPAGRRQIKFREVLSPLTKKYRSKFPDWFTWHIELQDVPDFKWVYGHIGNFESNSDACLLFNLGVREVNNEWQGIDSTNAFKKIYKLVSEALLSGEEVWIDIRDEVVIN